MRGVYNSACSLCYKSISADHQKCLLMRDCLLFKRLLIPESTVLTCAVNFCWTFFWLLDWNKNDCRKRISANISISCLLLPIVQEIGKLSDLSITKLFNLHNHDTNVWGFFCKKFLCCSLLWRGNIVPTLYNFITIFFSVYPLRYLGFYFDTLLKRKYFTHIPDLRGFIVGVYYGCQIEEVPGTTNV